MGSRRNPKQYKITFAEGTDYAGLEVTLRSLSIAQIEASRAADGDEDETISEAVSRHCRMVAGRIVSWNREDEDGVPVPPTLDSLRDEEPDLILAIVGKWTGAIVGVPAPLDEGSNSGEESAVESILTEIPSQSLAS